MTIRDNVRQAALAAADHRTVAEVRIGLGYSAMVLEDGRIGLAYTFHTDLPRSCNVLRNLRPLSGRPVPDLLALFESADTLSVTVALAAANALVNVRKTRYLNGDILEHLDLREDDRVCMIGHFAPLAPRIRRLVSDLRLCDQTEKPHEEILSEKEMYRHLTDATVTVLTATSIINHTIDALLEAAGSCREVVLLGASTPLIPEAFRHSPVTALSGVVVASPHQVLKTIGEGGGMRQFTDYVGKVTLPV